MSRDTFVILFAFLGSISLHILILPVVYVKKTPVAVLPTTRATHLETPKEDKPEIELGIDSSNEPTLTWIGYEEYEEQRARYAEVEQASMKATDEITKPLPSLQAFSTMQQAIQPVATVTLQFLEALQGIELFTPSRELQPIQPSREEPKKEPVKITPPVENVENTPTEGNPSDRDSGATSLVRFSPEQWKLGKPIAAQGIVLRPRRLPMKPYILFLNTPAPLVAELQINKEGKPQVVNILLSTGNDAYDQKWYSCLFRWRASGEKIDALKDDETLDITIQINSSE